MRTSSFAAIARALHVGKPAEKRCADNIRPLRRDPEPELSSAARSPLSS
jgi:hypothetical protein